MPPTLWLQSQRHFDTAAGTKFEPDMILAISADANHHTGAENMQDRLVEVFAQGLGIDSERLSDETNPDNTPEWGSLAAMELVALLEEAFADLGYPRQAFEPSLEQAFANILNVRLPTADPELELDVTTYRYADPDLEALSPLSKQLRPTIRVAP